MKIELTVKELEEAIQDYVFKKLGDTAYINGAAVVDRDNKYVGVECVEAYVKE